MKAPRSDLLAKAAPSSTLPPARLTTAVYDFGRFLTNVLDSMSRGSIMAMMRSTSRDTIDYERWAGFESADEDAQDRATEDEIDRLLDEEDSQVQRV